MRTTFFALAAALFAGVVSANSKANAFSIPLNGYTFTAGEPTTLTWNADSGSTVTLRLQSGAVTTANSGTVIASSINNDGSFTWDVPSDLPYKPDYTIEIIDDQDTSNYNFLPRFVVSGAVVVTSSSTSASSTSTSTSASSTSTTTVSTTSTTTQTSTSTQSTPTTMTTVSSSSASSSSAVSTTTQSTSTSASSTTASSTTASSTSAASVPTTNAGVVNRVSGGLLAAVAGAAMLL